MLIILKLAVIILLLVQILTVRLNITDTAAVAAELAVLLYFSPSGAAVIFRKNIMAVSTAFFFGCFAFISQLITKSVNGEQIALLTVRIFFVFNSILLMKYWIGRSGLISIISGIPFQHLRMFFILFMKITDFLLKSHTEILNRLKTRLDFNFSGKMLFARYYIQNLIQTEFYAYHNYQAALYTRLLGGSHELYSAKEKISFSSFILFLVAAGVTVIIFIT
ncbi:MAG: hypothetical protein JW864_13965 [Spirochaetes bacterium]|nr:hypothetical protein [Spirochaetota bacterium]